MNKLPYERWLHLVRLVLLSTGHFKPGLVLHEQSWKHYWESGYKPGDAVKEDLGYDVVIPFNTPLEG